MTAKIFGYSLWCFAKFAVGFSFILAMAIPRQKMIQDAQTETQCGICYNRSLTDTETYYEFAICHSSYIDQVNDNLIIDKKGWSVTASSVRTYKVVVAVLYPFLLIGSIGFLCLGCIAMQAGDDFQGEVMVVYALLFVQVNFYQSFGIMVLSNFIWGLYPYEGCYITPVGPTYIRAQYILLFIYIGFACIEGCCQNCFKNKIKHCAQFFNMFVLIAYSILSVIMSVITYQKSKDPTALVLVVLALASVFEVPAALIGYSLVTNLLGSAAGNFPLRVPTFRSQPFAARTARTSAPARPSQPWDPAATTSSNDITTTTATTTPGDEDTDGATKKAKEDDQIKFKFTNPPTRTMSASADIEVDELRTKKKKVGGDDERDEEDGDSGVTRVRGTENKKTEEQTGGGEAPKSGGKKNRRKLKIKKGSASASSPDLDSEKPSGRGQS